MRGLLARVDGEPAGAASLLIRDGLAMLAGASTLPAYRNRGSRPALAYIRLATPRRPAANSRRWARARQHVAS